MVAAIALVRALTGTCIKQMTFTYGLKTARDLLEKLKWDGSRLDHEVTSGSFFNFVITGYSLIDWLVFSLSTIFLSSGSVVNALMKFAVSATNGESCG
jgi:hypothetical protein